MRSREIMDVERLDRLEALLREHRLHEASCPVRSAQRTNAKGLWYVEPVPCDCWLSDP